MAILSFLHARGGVSPYEHRWTATRVSFLHARGGVSTP